MESANRDFNAAINIRRCAALKTRHAELTKPNFVAPPLMFEVCKEKTKADSRSPVEKGRHMSPGGYSFTPCSRYVFASLYTIANIFSCCVYHGKFAALFRARLEPVSFEEYVGTGVFCCVIGTLCFACTARRFVFVFEASLATTPDAPVEAFAPRSPSLTFPLEIRPARRGGTGIAGPNRSKTLAAARSAELGVFRERLSSPTAAVAAGRFSGTFGGARTLARCRYSPC